MKIVIILPIVFLLNISLLSGQKQSPKIFGTMPIDDTTAMCEREVSVKDWIYFMGNNNFDHRLFPDLSCLSGIYFLLFEDLKKEKINSKYIKVIEGGPKLNPYFGRFYFETTKEYKKLVKSDTNYFSINVPIVGISYAQASAYCLWKELLINLTQPIKVHVSLPTVMNYLKVIENGDSMNAKKCYLLNSLNCNCESVSRKRQLKSQGKALMDSDAYFASRLGLYNLQGNAAEMTRTEGTAMGGSYVHTARESYSDNRQYYTKPEKWLGFRYIVTSKK